MPKLDINKTNGYSKEYVFPDDNVLTIGRTELCDITLPDESRIVSRFHAALIRLPGGDADSYFLRDLGSLHGTKVNDVPVYHRVLEGGDVVQIGDYRLIFSAGTGTQSQLRHLKVAWKTVAERLPEGSTLALKISRILGEASFSPEQQELFEEIHHRTGRGVTFTQSPSELMAGILEVIQADQGIIGVFEDEAPEGYRELGSVNLANNEVIEILDAQFAKHLRNGHTIQEDATVLVPFYDYQAVKGFFCAHRRDRRRIFSTEDVTYLVGLGKVAWLQREKSATTVSDQIITTEPIEWPSEIVGKSEVMNELDKQISLAAATDMSVLILGETGSGKELIAKAIHQRSTRASGPFVARNCPQTTESLAETEIFGYAAKSGIADGNPQGTPGWFELAHGGTLFLDEVHRLSEAMQDKFLRVLQDKEVRRFGAHSSVLINVKVLAATDENLLKAIEEGRMRRPFYYRFGMQIQVPALRYRKEDIPLLAFYFLDKYARKLKSHARTVSHRALRQLMEYDWSGNVRQLEHLVHAAVAKDREVLFSWDLQEQFEHQAQKDQEAQVPDAMLDGKHGEVKKTPKTMDETEKEQIKEALEVTYGNVTRAAKLLGYKTRQTMLNKMDRYGIPRDYADPQSPGDRRSSVDRP